MTRSASGPGVDVGTEPRSAPARLAARACSGRPLAGARGVLRDAATRPAVLALGGLALRLLGRSLRVREIDRALVEPLWSAGEPVIYAVWHGRMLLLPYLYGRVREVHVLISRSRDGELVSRLVQGFGVRVVRGSSSRGGATALRTLARLIMEDRAEVVVVPDGPRGPRQIVKPGPVLLARLSGAPIVPVGFGAAPRRVFASWDALVLPLPFARAAVVFGQPIRVPPDADREGLERGRHALEAELDRVTACADGAAGVAGVRPL